MLPFQKVGGDVRFSPWSGVHVLVGPFRVYSVAESGRVFSGFRCRRSENPRVRPRARPGSLPSLSVGSSNSFTESGRVKGHVGGRIRGCRRKSRLTDSVSRSIVGVTGTSDRQVYQVNPLKKGVVDVRYLILLFQVSVIISCSLDLSVSDSINRSIDQSSRRVTRKTILSIPAESLEVF
jgi:hypothetical protein